MPAVVTTVPDVLTALVALGGTALPGVQIYDGPYDDDNLADEFLCVGFSRDEDEASVDGNAVDEGNFSSGESYAVHCILSVATGDMDAGAVARRRTRCSTLLGQFAGALRADPSLAGALVAGASARLGSFSWIYGQTVSGGSYAEVEFDVEVNASYLGAT